MIDTLKTPLHGRFDWELDETTDELPTAYVTELGLSSAIQVAVLAQGAFVAPTAVARPSGLSLHSPSSRT